MIHGLPPSEHTDRRAPAALGESFLVLAAITLVLAVYFGTFVTERGLSLSTKPDGYYGLLTDALLSGHLHLNVEPDPRLATLANPWLSYQGIPRLHDATYFHGHYYLYFGVAPVLLYYLPIHWITGSFAFEGSAAMVFGTVGFLAGLALLRRMRSQLLRTPPASWQALGILVWGLATYTLVDCQTATFYTVPILCAFACVTVALALVAEAMQAEAPFLAALLFAGASLGWGLSVASRPHFVLSLPLLGLPVVLLLCREKGNWARGYRLALLGAIILPAAVVGAALAWYNYTRFGSVSEFGFRYQFTGGDQRFITLWNPRLIVPNLLWYSFTDAVYVDYFPFVLQREPMVGFLAWSPFAALAAFFPATLASKRLRQSSLWVSVGGCAWATGCIHLLALSILPIGADRYLADFLPEFTLVALAVSMASFGLLDRLAGVYKAFAHPLLAALAYASLIKLSSLAVARMNSPGLSRHLALLTNAPVGYLQQALGGLKGPAELTVRFQPLPRGKRVPLVTTGMGRDVLFAEGVDEDNIRLGFNHFGNQPLLGTAFRLAPGRTRTLVIDLGGFYPPNTHPYFRGWDSDVADALHRRVTASLDGVSVLSANSEFYSTGVFTTRFGPPYDPTTGGPSAGISVVAVKRKPVPSEAEVTSTGWSGPVRLHLKFPPFDYVRSEPLLSTGSLRAADLIYVTYLGRGRARFGHDSSHVGGVETAEITFDPDAEHTLDIGLGSLEAPENTLPASTPGLRLKFDDRWLMAMARPSHPTHPYQIVFGYNSARLSTAEEAFAGPLLVPEHIQGIVAPATSILGDGPLSASVRFAPFPSAPNEPLVVSGVEGKGDIVFVNYMDKKHIKIGIDHWAVGMKLSDPIEVTPNTVYTVTVSSAAFLPDAESPQWKTLPSHERDSLLSAIRVFVNGKLILEAPWKAYPADDSQISVGVNTIGGSTCSPRFSGAVIEAHRTGLPVGASATRDAGSVGKARL